jgi:hypothetical protein
MIIQKKTKTPVRFEITAPTGEAVNAWIRQAGLTDGDWLFPSRIGIGAVVLLSFHKGLHIDRRDQLHVMPDGTYLPAPVMSARTSLHRDDAFRLSGEERQHSRSRKLLPNQGTAVTRSAMRLKDILAQIQTNDANFSHGRLLFRGSLTPLPWHIDAVGGRPPHRTPVSRAGSWFLSGFDV